MDTLLSFVLMLVPVTLIVIAYLRLTNSIRSLSDLRNPGLVHDFFTSKSGMYFVFAWGVAESLYWWIFPDFLLVPAGYYVRRFIPKILIYATVGTAVGGILAYAVGAASPSVSDALVEHTPFMEDEMVEFVDRTFLENDALGVIYQPTSGVPFKVFAYHGGQQTLNIFVLMSVGTAVRFIRFGIAYVGAYVAGRMIGKYFGRIPPHYGLVIYLVVFTIARIYLPITKLIATD